MIVIIAYILCYFYTYSIYLLLYSSMIRFIHMFTYILYFMCDISARFFGPKMLRKSADLAKPVY